MPLGEGYTVEEQLAGAAVHGGVQSMAYPMKAERYAALRPKWGRDKRLMKLSPGGPDGMYAMARYSMGLAPGGRMKQKIYDDPYGLDAWDRRNGSRCFVSLLNTAQWMAIAAERPPTKPPTAQDYAACGLPWFDYYDADARAVAGSGTLRGLMSVARQARATGQKALPDNETIAAAHVIGLGKPRQVREGAGDRA